MSDNLTPFSPQEKREAEHMKYRAKLRVLSEVMEKQAIGLSEASAKDIAKVINAAFDDINL